MGMLEENKGREGIYLSIAGGNLGQKVEESTPGAVRRDYELKDGTKGFKYEKIFKSVTGYLIGVGFNDGKFGKQLVITLGDGANKVIINMGTDSKYFGSFASKLPNVDISQEVSLSVYDFETDEGKRMTGVTLVQGGSKVQGYYYDVEAKKSLHGLPSVSGEEARGYDSDDWKVFFLGVKKFYIKQIEEAAYKYEESNIPEGVVKSAVKEEPKQYAPEPTGRPEEQPIMKAQGETKKHNSTDDISVEDIPF